MPEQRTTADAAGSTGPLVRSVRGRTLTSAADPRVEISFDEAYQYAGGQRWELHGVADAEQHLFLEPATDGTAARLYWIQFERFLPTNRHTYNYPLSRTVEIGGLSFVYDARAYADFAALNRDPASDGAHAQALLRRRGYAFPKAAIRLRMIHLPTANRRSELMIIYAESVDAGKLPPNAEEGLALDAQAPTLAGGVLKAALSGIRIHESSGGTDERHA